MKTTILFTSLAVTLASSLLHAPVLRADESAYAPLCYDADEAKEQRSIMRTYLEPAHVPSPEFLASCVGNKRRYTGKETPEELKAICAKYQDTYNTIVAALPEKLSVPVAQKRKILVLTYRTGLDYHAPGAGGYLILLREAAKKYGDFELTEAYKPDGIDAKMLAGFDAVVLNNLQSVFRQGKYGPQFGLLKTHPELKAETEKRRIEEQAVNNLLYRELLPAYVNSGGGLVGVHATALLEMGQADKATEFGTMLGGMVDEFCHPHTKSGGWAKYNPFVVKLLEPQNPVVAAFSDVPAEGLSTELYSFFLPKSCMNDTRVLAGRKEDGKDVVYHPKSVERCKDMASALVWIRSYGKGRVYYNVMGHGEEIFAVPCVARAMLDGLLYATGDLKVPDAPATAAGK